jgi:hypothetical protein
MSNGPANLSVWVKDDLVCIRIAGRASFQCSVDFKTLVNSLRQKGHQRFVLDLAWPKAAPAVMARMAPEDWRPASSSAT